MAAWMTTGSLGAREYVQMVHGDRATCRLHRGLPRPLAVANLAAAMYFAWV